MSRGTQNGKRNADTQIDTARPYRGEWCSGLKVSAWSWWPCLGPRPPCVPSANQWAPWPRSSWGKFAGGAADPWSPSPHGAAAWKEANGPWGGGGRYFTRSPKNWVIFLKGSSPCFILINSFISRKSPTLPQEHSRSENILVHKAQGECCLNSISRDYWSISWRPGNPLVFLQITYMLLSHHLFLDMSTVEQPTMAFLQLVSSPTWWVCVQLASITAD